MKKFLTAFLAVSMLLFLCGCETREAIASDKQEYIVASLGFDNEMGKIKMLIEAIIVNTDDLEEDKSGRVISGTGETVDEAFSEIISKITQPLSLGHNAITAIGSKITPSQLDEIFAFCQNNNQINIATMLIFTDNAQKLLSSNTVSSVAVGYDVMSMIEVGQEEKGTAFKNRFYEAQSLKEKPLKTFFMPYITVENEETALNGLTVFKENKPVKTFSNDEIPLFCLVTDSLSRGEIVLGGVKTEIKYAKVTYDFDFKDNLVIDINIRFKANGDTASIKEKTESLLNGEDFFNLGNIISQKKPKIWEKIKCDYDSYYQNAEIRVNVYE